MSDVGPEELGLLAALDVLEARSGEIEARLRAGDDAAAALRRQQLDAIVALAWVLPATPVSASRRDELLGRLHGDETVMVPQPQRGEDTGPVAATPQAAAVSLGVLDPPAAPGPLPPASRPAPPAVADRPRRPPAMPLPAAIPRRSYRWALPLAAVFALAALGVGYHDFTVGQQLESTRQELLASRREGQQLAERLRAAEVNPQLAALRDQMREMDTQLRLVTSPGTAVCALRPSHGAPVRDAKALLYVAPDHQHWYLRAQNLPAPGEGRVYHLWFLVGERPVPAGTFQLVGDEAVMSSPTMPEGTSAALVTVEPTGAPGERPTGPAVLYGKDMVALL